MTLPQVFSERETEVVALLLQGKSNKQIALELGISNRTAEFHLSNIYAKLEVSSRTEAILKLTEDHLRESTGTDATDTLRESTVDKRDETAENGNIPFSQRRIPMKHLLPIIGAILTTTAVAVLVIFANQPSGTAEMALDVQDNDPGIVAADAPVPTDTSLPDPAPAYSYVAANIISTGDMTIEISPRLSPDVLEFGITAIYLEEVQPEMTDSLFEKVEFTFEGDHSGIRLEEFSGGGGGGPGIMEQVSIFKVVPPLEVGQVVKLHVLVTFSDFIGLTEPVSFDLELPVGEPFPLRGNGGG